jgi:hypothetical protein
MPARFRRQGGRHGVPIVAAVLALAFLAGLVAGGL